MMKLSSSINSWNTPEFRDVLKDEIEQLDAEQLPLQQGLANSSYVGETPFRMMIIGVSDDSNAVRVHAGIFYAGIIAGCNCSDDPTPVDEQPEYCEVEVVIDKTTAEAKITLVQD
ncbi:MAG: hypothetical protein OI74_10820 [Gammaproteobacteria bacterium (ex Lamellibrachia satsuma)]|nr:MAG: hypothetical protein HPY30_13840 [Gammaproteobacteria bacterium (ex Lamellibrachia satsuma)]RRS32530.1 MAG: hypothetical protein OI74_10820 [Gammaproteobacteria bacterium (ex Lamellibrachia satsuma)]RRS36721.1 MAG: hypothetical protein NV67_05285 [Gammaproteobacteria bacterium (ex Lamellibrachia satsuma)]